MDDSRIRLDGTKGPLALPETPPDDRVVAGLTETFGPATEGRPYPRAKVLAYALANEIPVEQVEAALRRVGVAIAADTQPAADDAYLTVTEDRGVVATLPNATTTDVGGKSVLDVRADKSGALKTDVAAFETLLLKMTSPDVSPEWVTSPEAVGLIEQTLRAIPAKAIEHAVYASLETVLAHVELAEHELDTSLSAAKLFGRDKPEKEAKLDEVRGFKKLLRKLSKSKLGRVARSIKKTIRQIFESIVPSMDDVKGFLKEKGPVVLLMQGLFVGLAAMKGLPLLPAAVTGLGFIGLGIAITQIIEHLELGIVENMAKFIPPSLLTVFKSAASNLGELATVLAIMFGAASADLPAVLGGALISNPVNMALLLVAGLIGFTIRARKKNPDLGDEAPGIKEVLKRANWPDMLKQIGLGLGLAVDAAIFMKLAEGFSSNPWPTAIWAGLNLVGFVFGFKKLVLGDEAKMKATIDDYDSKSLGELADKLSRQTRVPAIDGMLDAMAAYRAVNEPGVEKPDIDKKETLENLLGAVQTLKRQLGGEATKEQAQLEDELETADDPAAIEARIAELQPEVDAERSALASLRALELNPDNDELVEYFRNIGVHTPFEAKPWYSEGNHPAIIKATLAVTALTMVASQLGPSAEALGGALDLPLAVIVGFAALSSSLPEAVLMTEAFGKNQDLGATSIASQSNWLNAGAIASGATLLVLAMQMLA